MIPQGYKQTEIGVIPEDWDCVAAKHLMKIETGSRNTEHKTDIGKYPFFVRSQKVERIDTYHYDCEAVLTAGDGVGTGKVFHHYIGKFDAHQRVYVMSNFDGITGRYFYNYFSENFGNEVSKYTAKSSVDSVRRDMIAEMLIPTPTILEQERIAEALLDVDSMISSLEKLIAKKKAIKQGAMQELLTGKKRLPGFTEGWKNLKFKETNIEVLKGQTITQKDISFGKIPVIAGGKTPAYYCDKFNRTGTNITISASGASAGFVNKYSGDIFASDCSTISESIKYNIDFVYYLLLNNQNVIYASQTGGAQPHIHPNDIYELTIYYTFDIGEQNAIASILSDMDNEIEALEQKLDKTRQIKQGMMQQLLTGKIRLV